ncbi:MAG: NosD domain-containing protein [Verrucomicrobiota bacterium]
MAPQIHVAQTGNDRNPGTEPLPLATISQAAAIARPGDTVVVHGGTYREWVKPRRGGTSEVDRITYCAADGERPVIKGSEKVEDWERTPEGVWKAVLPDSFFGEHNPFRTKLGGDWFKGKGRDHHTGEVFIDGQALLEAASLAEVIEPIERCNVFPPGDPTLVWYCESTRESTTIWANFADRDPNDALVEVTARPCCFYPEKTNINYITVRGFEMCQSATQWAPPTAEQQGLIGPHWAKGWIIEANIIHDAKCSGISLGKDISTGQNEWTRLRTKHGTQREREVIFRALRNGWNKENVGSHIVRNNEIFRCGQTGICGHLGCIFSTISNNHIYHIHTHEVFSGAEIAGIKLHAPIDTVIRDNYIHDSFRGIWLDWQAQGTRLTGNLLHDCWTGDLFTEVSHGPTIIDNNLFLSEDSLLNVSQGSAFAHNLFAGFTQRKSVPNRFCPYHFPHSTDVAGLMTILGGDDRYFNNIFTSRERQAPLGDDALDAGDVIVNEVSDTREKRVSGTDIFNGFPLETDNWHEGQSPDDYARHKLPVRIASNLYYQGAEPYERETNPMLNQSFDPEIELVAKDDGIYLEFAVDRPAEQLEVPSVDSEKLGAAFEPEVPFENADGTPIGFASDYLGEPCGASPLVGPFQNLRNGPNSIKVWPKAMPVQQRSGT